MPLHKGTTSTKFLREKKCPRCGVISDKHRRLANGYLKAYCNDCDYQRQLEWKRKNQGKVAAHRRAERLKWHGLTFEQYDNLLSSQGGGCAICHLDNKRLVVDHNHDTFVVRGILCNACNTAIGMLQESKVIMLAAIQYLEKEAPVTPLAPEVVKSFYPTPMNAPNIHACPRCGMIKSAGKCLTKGCK